MAILLPPIKRCLLQRTLIFRQTKKHHLLKARKRFAENQNLTVRTGPGGAAGEFSAAMLAVLAEKRATDFQLKIAWFGYYEVRNTKSAVNILTEKGFKRKEITYSISLGQR